MSVFLALAVGATAQAPFWLPVGDMPSAVITRMWANPAGDLFMTSNFPVHRPDGNGGNLFRSADGGTSWADMTVPLGNEAVWAFAQHPATGRIVIATQSPRDPLSPVVATRIRSTTDLGQNWSLDNNTTFTGDKPVFALSYDATGTWLYAANKQSGVKRSNTNGATWTTINTGLTNLYAKDLEWGVGGLLYACTDSASGNGGKVFSYNGTSWTDVSAGLPGGGIQDIQYDAATLTMYAAVNSLGAANPGRLYKRVNAGTWTLITGYPGYSIDRLMIDAAGVVYMHANHQGVYRYDGSWSTMNTGLVPLWGTACTAAPSGLYTATRAGLYKWNSTTNAWVAHHHIRSLATPLAIAFGPSGEILAGTLHGVYRSADHGASWTQVALGEMTILALSYDAQRNQFLTGTNNNTASECWRSPDGINWSLGNNGFTSLRVLDFAYLPDGRVICGTGWQRPVSYSNDGLNWSGGNAMAMGYTSGTISLGLAVDNVGRIWSATEAQGIYRSDDAVPTHFTHMGFSGGNTIDVGITPLQDVFVAHQLSGSADGYLYRWRNSSNAWVVPNNILPAGTGLIDCTLATNNADIFAGTQNGCYQSADTGMTWTQRATGLHPGNRIVQTLERGPDGHLYAGIAGGGLFRSAVPVGSPYVTVSVKVLLEGPFDGTLLMNDALRTLDLIPTMEPFTSALFTHAGDGGGEVISRSVLETTGANAIVDWVMLELRSSTSPTSVIATRSALLQRDGDVVELDGSSPVIIAAAPGSYHVSVRHRNHLGVMTASPITLSTSAVAVDFTNPATATYGTQAQKSIGSKMVLWAGNTLLDGAASTLRYVGAGNDRDPILVRIGGVVPTNTVNGYLLEDVNLDGEVKYIGAGNDRDPILVNIGGSITTNTRVEQLP
ncbi:MAG: hypothetical protein IPL52_01510 [Flavobacteriales bacterium]|nr:hypothetical protein [Flavobacteriales bacterium]